MFLQLHADEHGSQHGRSPCLSEKSSALTRGAFRRYPYLSMEQSWMGEAANLGMELLTQSEQVLTHLSGGDRPPILYHFTPVSGFLSILKDQCLWATDARYFNDSSELQFIGEVAAEVGIDLLSKATSSAARVVVAWVTGGAVASGTYGHLPTRLRFARDVFVASLSESWQVLSQWRAYAADGAGYAIGFEGGFDWRIKSTESDSDQARARLVKVIYDRGEQKELIRPLLENVVAALNRCSESSEEIEHATFSASGSLAWALERLAVVCKNPGFREEKEWRLVASNPFVHGNIHFRTGRFGLTPYVQLCGQKRLPLKEVAIGPRISSFESRQATISYVSQEFPNVSLTEDESTIPPAGTSRIVIRTSGISYR